MIFCLYDSTGIQNYIFSTSKLKEIVGGSLLVSNLFNKFLKKAIYNAGYEKKSIIEWNRKDKYDFNSQDFDVEIIYVGGGNAAVLYKNKDIMKNVNTELSLILLNEALSVGYVSDYCELNSNDNFKEKRDDLLRKIENLKHKNYKGNRLLGLPITKPSNGNGYPAINKYNEDGVDYYCSSEVMCKRNIEEKTTLNEKLDSVLEEFNNKYEFPLDLDNLGLIEGESYIGIVHIDGNSMGSNIDNFLSNWEELNKSIEAMRELSISIENIYIELFKKLIRDLIRSIETKKFDFLNENANYLPIRPIIIEGDDISFICNGKLALGLAEKFLQYLEEQKELSVMGKNIKLSACAGISIVKSHFPIDKTYEIAESCCSSAKRKAKAIAKENGEEVGNWLDFHIVNTGILNNLDKMREENYNINLSQNTEDYPRYNLLYRPWCISGNNKYSWRNFREIFYGFKKWPRSLSKDLKEVFSEGKEEVNKLILKIISRGHSIVLINEINQDNLFDNYDMTPYYDVLEAYDLYYEI